MYKKSKVPPNNPLSCRYLLNNQEKRVVETDRNDVRNILSGKDGRKILIIGPCSAWPMEASLIYANKLKELQKHVKEKFKIIMRVYVQKSRTSVGWTGPFFQPDPFKAPDINRGIFFTRKLMKLIIKAGIPIATEILFPNTAAYFSEYVTFGVIGARSSENPEHRLFASSANFPIGLKNGRDGNMINAINSVHVAQQPGTLYLDRQEINTDGNPYSHLILRGSIFGQNYDKKSINTAVRLMKKTHIKHPVLIIDASHDNCLVKGKKKFSQQINVIQKITQYIRKNKKNNIKGLMIESFLKGGSQDIAKLSKKTVNRGGMSITDPCLSFEDTEKLIYKLAYEI